MRERVKGLGLTCSIEGCSKPVKCKRMCATHYLREWHTGSALTKVDPSRQILGKSAEEKVRTLLESYGRSVEFAPHYMADFDLLVDGKRIDVKCSTFHKLGGKEAQAFGWFINITHWGKVDESGKDAYIFRLEPAPHMQEAIHLFFPVPIARASVHISPQLLLDRYYGAIADFFAFAKGQGVREVAA